MKVLRIQSSNHEYPIYVDRNLRKNVSEIIPYDNYSQLVIITDDQVKNLYLSDLITEIRKFINVSYYVIKSGEESKTLKVYEDIQKFLLKKQLDRQSCIMALGGGVVGDLTGFVAATYMRGISFIQMPTTLLAQDSSIGGKVGINLDETKNVIGSFYPPDCVIYDTEMFDTLDEQQLRSGFAEMVKHGFISNQKFLSQLKQQMMFQIDTHNDFNELLIQSLQIKKKIIEQDERENDLRRYLNFGHTLGHAIESTSKHSSLTHGECVMYGIMFALYVSDRQFQISSPLLNSEFIGWVKRLNYPLNLISEQDIDCLIAKMLNDKKNRNGQINFVLLKDIAEPVMESLSQQQIRVYLYEFIKFIKDV